MEKGKREIESERKRWRGTAMAEMKRQRRR
jgi:hypothetical protein